MNDRLWYNERVQKEALVRVHEKAMQRYTEVRDETVWRPDLGQRVSEYHRGLLTHIGTYRYHVPNLTLFCLIVLPQLLIHI